MSLGPSHQEIQDGKRTMFRNFNGEKWEDVEKLIKENPGPFVISYQRMDGPSVRSYVIDRYVLGISCENGYIPFDTVFLDYNRMAGSNPTVIGNLSEYFGRPTGIFSFSEAKKITEVSFRQDEFDGHLLMALNTVWSSRLESRSVEFVPKDDIRVRSALLSEEELQLHTVITSFVKRAKLPAVNVEIGNYLDFVTHALGYWQKREREMSRCLAAANVMTDRYETIQRVLLS